SPAAGTIVSPVAPRLRRRYLSPVRAQSRRDSPVRCRKMKSMGDLKLVALDAEDLKVISAHVQDAVLQVGDMAYRPSEHRFAAIANRFDWAAAVGATGDRPSLERRRTGLRFERVLEAKCQGIDPRSKRDVLELLAIQFDETEPPGGYITLVFAGGGAV